MSFCSQPQKDASGYSLLPGQFADIESLVNYNNPAACEEKTPPQTSQLHAPVSTGEHGQQHQQQQQQQQQPRWRLSGSGIALPSCAGDMPVLDDEVFEFDQLLFDGDQNHAPTHPHHPVPAHHDVPNRGHGGHGGDGFGDFQLKGAAAPDHSALFQSSDGYYTRHHHEAGRFYHDDTTHARWHPQAERGRYGDEHASLMPTEWTTREYASCARQEAGHYQPADYAAQQPQFGAVDAAQTSIDFSVVDDSAFHNRFDASDDFGFYNGTDLTTLAAHADNGNSPHAATTNHCVPSVADLFGAAQECAAAADPVTMSARSGQVEYACNKAPGSEVANVTGAVYGGGETFAPGERYNNLLDSTGRIVSKKTAYNEKWGVKVLKAWCTETKTSEDFEKLTAVQLNKLLCCFWAEVRKANGDYYGRNSMFNLRAMINKHLKSQPFCVSFDIVTDDRFRTSNERLEGQLKMLKGIGKTITHKQPIAIHDLRKMYDSGVLGMKNPLALLRKVWFEVTLHFCHKGSESQERLRKTTFGVHSDAYGRRYVARNPSSSHREAGDKIRMYETGGELCPVGSFEFYLTKLHTHQGRLFQQPRRKSAPNSGLWFGKAPIGEKALQQMMANISTASRLSKRYTNHCVRTTALEQFTSKRKRRGAANEKRQNPGDAERRVPSYWDNHYEGSEDPGIDFVVSQHPFGRPSPYDYSDRAAFGELREHDTPSSAASYFAPVSNNYQSDTAAAPPYPPPPYAHPAPGGAATSQAYPMPSQCLYYDLPDGTMPVTTLSDDSGKGGSPLASPVAFDPVDSSRQMIVMGQQQQQQQQQQHGHQTMMQTHDAMSSCYEYAATHVGELDQHFNSSSI